MAETHIFEAKLFIFLMAEERDMSDDEFGNYIESA